MAVPCHKQLPMIRFVQKLLNPFPYTRFSSKNAVHILGVGGFIAAFLYFFYGDRFESMGHAPVELSLLFGGCTASIGFIFDIAADRFLRHRQYHLAWTFDKWTAYMTTLILTIAVANYLLFLVITDSPFSLSIFLEVTKHTAAIGLFPVVFSVYSKQLWVLKHAAISPNTCDNLETETQGASILLTSKKENQQLLLQLDDIRYIETNRNYVVVCHISNGNTIERTMLRNTMANIQHQVADTSLRRCHRSFIVNSAHIMSAAGNAAGLKLRLKNLPSTTIPVSRTYLPSFRSIL